MGTPPISFHDTGGNVAGHGRVRSETSLFYCCFGFSVTTYRLSYILLRATGEEGVNAL